MTEQPVARRRIEFIPNGYDESYFAIFIDHPYKIGDKVDPQEGDLFYVASMKRYPSLVQDLLNALGLAVLTMDDAAFGVICNRDELAMPKNDVQEDS